MSWLEIKSMLDVIVPPIMIIVIGVVWWVCYRD